MNKKMGPSVCIICVMLLAALFQVVEGRPRRDRDGSNAHNTQQESKVNIAYFVSEIHLIRYSYEI